MNWLQAAVQKTVKVQQPTRGRRDMHCFVTQVGFVLNYRLLARHHLHQIVVDFFGRIRAASMSKPQPLQQAVPP